MASFFDKVRTGVLAIAHRAADAVIDLNSVEAVKVHIRDLEEAQEDLQGAAAEATGGVRTLRRERDTTQAKVTELDESIGFILSDGDDTNDHLAVPLQARLDGLKAQLAAKEDEIATAEQVAQQMNEAASALQAKLTSMVERVRGLEAQERAAKAKESAASAVAQAGKIAAGADAVSVDDISARLQRRTDVADEKFKRAMGGISGGLEQDVALAKAKAAIAARKAALQKPKEGDAPAAKAG
ncbi:PspA/IM30 family protein [Candidatus Uhrbacteria bacterium]|nr:PspA/IM30 family protein [Candidatus Uhrbacteria bacterium]